MRPDIMQDGSDGIRLSDKDVRKYLLQFILQCKGIIQENVLLSCFLTLEFDSGRLRNIHEDDEKVSLDLLAERLNQHITELNVELNPFHYRIDKINHPMGKRYVSAKFRNMVTDLVPFDWPISGRFYIYLNTKFESQMKLATSFTPTEISFIKFCIDSIMLNGNDILSFEARLRNSLVKEIDSVFQRNQEPQFHGLMTCVLYKIGSGLLMNNEEIGVTKVEEILMKLTENKWFSRFTDGKIGIDIKFVLEMKDYLVDNYHVATCVTCDSVVLQGIICGRCREEFNHGWHVDCLDHYLKHVDQRCPSCQALLSETGTYVIG